jgi:hypothetical protein
MTNPRNAVLEVIFVGVVMVVLSLAGIASGFFAKIIFDIDGLLLVSVCLMMAFIFAVMLLVTAKQWGLLGKKPAGAAAAPVSTPTAPAGQK